MFRWLRNLAGSSRARPSREALLNEGLELAMDWGENWLSPIQGRLLQRHGFLRGEELDDLAAACQEAMKFGHETAYAMVRERGKDISQDDFMALVLAKHPWLDAANAERLYKQSMYYAWKTGGPARGI